MLHTIRLDRARKERLLQRSKTFVDFRMKCVGYLKKHGRLEDKFTVSNRDPQKRRAAYVVEEVLRDELPKLYPDCVRGVGVWRGDLDLKRIIEIVEAGAGGHENVELVATYFYDHWDLAIQTGRGTCLCDVKTAMTKKSPEPTWDFLYPVVQAEKLTKDFVILAHFVCDKQAARSRVVDGEIVIDPEHLTHVVLAGATTPATIRTCRVLQPGEQTDRGIVSRIENHWTVLDQHYKEVDALLCGK